MAGRNKNLQHAIQNQEVWLALHFSKVVNLVDLFGGWHNVLKCMTIKCFSELSLHSRTALLNITMLGKCITPLCRTNERWKGEKVKKNQLRVFCTGGVTESGTKSHYFLFFLLLPLGYHHKKIKMTSQWYK